MIGRGMCGLLLLLSAANLSAQKKIGSIEFFGSKGIDVNAIRQQLPIRSGSMLEPGWKEGVREAVTRITGTEPTDIAAICCDESRSRTVFIGLRGTTYRQTSYRPAPDGKQRLPDAILALYVQEGTALKAAVSSGNAGEDDSKGYALAEDSAARAVQLKMRQFALGHAGELETIILHSSDFKQREAASDFLGYAVPSNKQVQVLVNASTDPNEDVRNNATRALGVLFHAQPGFAKGVNPAGLIAMLHSGVWTDRNKSAFVLQAMTVSRDPALLKQLREQAWNTLLEMASWKDAGHAYSSRMILGRITGIPEDRLQKVVWNGPLDELINTPRPPLQ